MKPFVFLALLVPALALADTFVPYTDDREGGCYLTPANVMYGCTPQTDARASRRDLEDAYEQGAQDAAMSSLFHRPAPPPRAAEPEVVYVPSAPDAGLAVYAPAPAPPPRSPAERTHDARIAENLEGSVSLSECSKRGKTPTCTNAGCVCK
jgi:hypothetical protein